MKIFIHKQNANNILPYFLPSGWTWRLYWIAAGEERRW